LDFPTALRVPTGWLYEHGGPAIRLRTYRDLLPAGQVSAEEMDAAEVALVGSSLVAPIL